MPTTCRSVSCCAISSNAGEWVIFAFETNVYSSSESRSKSSISEQTYARFSGDEVCRRTVAFASFLQRLRARFDASSLADSWPSHLKTVENIVHSHVATEHAAESAKAIPRSHSTSRTVTRRTRPGATPRLAK